MELDLTEKTVGKLFGNIQRWLSEDVFILETLLQLGALAVSFVVAYFATGILRRWLRNLFKRYNERVKSFLLRSSAASDLLLPVVWLALQGILLALGKQFEQPHQVIMVTSNLLMAWIAIRFTSGLVRIDCCHRLEPVESDFDLC